MPTLNKVSKAYLASSEFINWENHTIQALARTLSAHQPDDNIITKKCFEWVRDNIKHSFEYQLNPVTCKASDVLKHKTGYCFAKSHLLTALLRANSIPAGLCYQRLSIDDKGAPFSLHGFTAAYLSDYGWYRIDPRGNNKSINAQFTPPKEQLAFSIKLDGEIDFSDILEEPLPIVTDVLTRCKSYQEVFAQLPDTCLL